MVYKSYNVDSLLTITTTFVAIIIKMDEHSFGVHLLMRFNKPDTIFTAVLIIFN